MPYTIDGEIVEAVTTTAKPRVYFSRELAQCVCDGIAAGKSVRQVCDRSEHMPTPQAFYLWLAGRGISEDDAHWLQEGYLAAQLARADVFVEESIDIADDSRNDYMEITLKNGDVIDRVDTEAIQRSKLRIDTRLWAAGRLNPEKYGPKAILTVKKEPLTPSAREGRIAELMQKCLPKARAANEDKHNGQSDEDSNQFRNA